MKLYDPKRDELKILYWWLHLTANPTEYENLFTEPLRSLTEILYWAKHTVAITFDSDDDGIWIATWIEPTMSGAYFGLWVRQDKRQTKGMLRFVNQSIDIALETFPVLMAPTKQQRLQGEMERLGFVKQGEIPYLFDGKPAGVYYLTRETRNARFKWRKDQQRHREQPLRASHREIREGVPAGGQDLRSTGNGSVENGGSERTNPNHKPRRRRKPRGGVVSESGHAAGVGESGIS